MALDRQPQDPSIDPIIASTASEQFGKDLDVAASIYSMVHDMKLEKKEHETYLNKILLAVNKHKGIHVHAGKYFDLTKAPLAINKFIYHIQLLYEKSIDSTVYSFDMQRYLMQTKLLSQSTNVKASMQFTLHRHNKEEKDVRRFNLMGEPDGFDKTTGLRTTVEPWLSCHF